MNSEIFFNLSTDKISIIVFDKDKKEDIYNKTQNFDKSLSKDIFIKKNLNSTLEKQILYAFKQNEMKKSGYYLKIIFFIGVEKIKLLFYGLHQPL